MKEDLTENPQKGELNFGEKFNIEQCPENDHLFCTDICDCFDTVYSIKLSDYKKIGHSI